MKAGRSALALDGHSFRLSDAARVLRGEPLRVRLTPAAQRAIRSARALIERKLASREPLYGINTGFGRLSSQRIADADLGRLQQNLLMSHACGTGAPLQDGIARLALLLRANTVAQGHSGVRLELVQRLLDLFERGVVPEIPEQGSVGASGDLAPLAHLALLLIGRGAGRVVAGAKSTRRLTGAQIARKLALEPLALEPKEGLALINGTQISTAIAVDGIVRARRLARIADVALSLSLEALRGSARAFDPRIHRLRAHPGQLAAAANVLRLLAGSKVIPSHANCGKVQDAYSLRCGPQVHGAARDTLDHAERVLEREMNCVTDNPLVFPADDAVLNGGNFHAEPVAMVADFAAIAVAELANISERRIENMVNPDYSGLPAFLAGNPGLDSGFMLAQVTAAALVSENKTLCHPASVDSIPTSAGKEDHVSMATWAARKLRLVVANAENVLAIELLAAAQALDLQPWIDPGRGAHAAYRAVRARVKPMARDREIAPDVAAVRELIEDGSLLAAAEAAAGALA